MHTAIVAHGAPQHDLRESQQRAIDNVNNMMCEYATSIIGAAMLLYLPYTPHFVLASAEQVSGDSYEAVEVTTQEEARPCLYLLTGMRPPSS